MAMNNSFINALADHGGTLITHVALVNGSGTELSGGTYARQTVTWTTATGGLVRPTADRVFNVPAGSVVAGWRGFTALTGGTNHGGEALTSETFTGDGTYTLLAASTAIDLNAL